MTLSLDAESLVSVTTRVMHVNGVDLNVAIVGEGPDVLLVHGFPDCHDVWRHQIPALVNAGYRVIAPDTRGCGDSAISPSVPDYHVDNLVVDLVGLLDELGIEKVRLVGHDFGAVFCWQLVLKHPDRVDRYVALSVGHMSAYARAGLLQKLKGYYVLLLQLRGVSELLLRCCNWLPFRLMTRFKPEFEHWRTQLSRPGRLTAALSYYRANLRHAFSRNLPPATVPVLGVWSSKDIALAEDQMVNSENYVQADWQYRRIEGASHWLQLDAPDEINAILLDYLK